MIKQYIKKGFKILLEYVVVLFLIEVFTYYFQCLPRVADYINNSTFFKGDIGSTILWIYLELVPMIVSVIMVVTFIKKYMHRDFFVYLSLEKSSFLKHIGLGSIFSIFSMLFIVLFGICINLYTISFSKNIDILLLIIYFFGFIIQCFVEEIIYRGILYKHIKEDFNICVAGLLSAILFSLSHIENDGIGVLALINLFIFGLLMNVLLEMTNSLWTAIGFHVMWNFMQGNFWGLEVSGITFDTSLFVTRCNLKIDFLTGATFGIEGGVICTVLLLIMCSLILFLNYKKEKALMY